MAITVLSNPTSVSAQRALNNSQQMLTTSLQKLATGQRINSAGDDAAGLAISERMKTQMRSLQQASRNAQDGVSAMQIADGALDQVGGLLTRMRELSVQSANGTLGTAERTALQAEFSSSGAEITRISAVTQFNGANLLDGTFAATLQVGTGTSASDTLSAAIAQDCSATGLSVNASTIATAAGATAAMTAVDAAINLVTAQRGAIGAVQNRLTVTIDNLSSAYENTSAANSRIRDVDFAEETAKMTRAQVLQQAGANVLQQANALPQTALSLLGR